MEGIVFRSSDNQALTTSAIVAEKFGKEHKNVLSAIRELFNVTAEKSALIDNQQLAKMFALTEVEQPMPVGGVKKIPVYVMNRDGFTLLAMGFTGAKALAFKLEYINAFNAMEQQIRQSSGVPQSFAQALLVTCSLYCKELFGAQVVVASDYIKKYATEIVLDNADRQEMVHLHNSIAFERFINHDWSTKVPDSLKRRVSNFLCRDFYQKYNLKEE